MKRTRGLAATALVLAVAAVAASRNAAPSRAEGVFEYVGDLKGQAILQNGRFVFLHGPSDNSAPMIAEAGTYTVARDTFEATITYSTVPASIGGRVSWTAVSWSGDTLTYALLDTARHEAGRGRGVKRQ
jgi:hypothetical protein